MGRHQTACDLEEWQLDTRSRGQHKTGGAVGRGCESVTTASPSLQKR